MTPYSNAPRLKVTLKYSCDVKGWTLSDLIDDAQYELLQKESRVEMKTFVQDDGTVAFRSPAHIITANRS